MLIRVILITAFAAIAYFAFLKRRTAPVHIIVVMLLLALASIFVLAPELSTAMAHAVGVGRGVDLVMYLVQTGLFFIVVHYFTKFVEMNTQITHLAREITLLRAELERLKGSRPE
jgi:small membrane protein